MKTQRRTSGWMFLGVLLLACAVSLWPSLTAAQSSSGDALVVAAGETRSTDISTISQPIVINGVVEGDVTSISGSITVRGSVEGDVVSLFGNVTFEPEAVTEGHVMAATGVVTIPAGAAVASGGTVFNGNVAGGAGASLLPGSGNQPLGSLGRVVLALVLGVIALAVTTLLSLIWPKSIGSAARTIQLAPQRAFGLGLIWLLLTLVIVGVAAVALIFSLVGLTVLPVLILMAQIPYLVGLAAVGQAIGERLGLNGLTAVSLGSVIVILPSVLLAIVSLPAAFGLFYALAGIGIGGLGLLRATVALRNSSSY